MFVFIDGSYCVIFKMPLPVGLKIWVQIHQSVFDILSYTFNEGIDKHFVLSIHPIQFYLDQLNKVGISRLVLP